MIRKQAIIDFNNNGQINLGEYKSNDLISFSILLRRGKEPIDLTNKKVNVFMEMKNCLDRQYLNSNIKILNEEKGLIQFDVNCLHLFTGEYVGEFDVLDSESGTFETSGVFEIKVIPRLSDSVNLDALVNIKKIETLQQLDMYVEEAIKKLEQLDITTGGGQGE